MNDSFQLGLYLFLAALTSVAVIRAWREGSIVEDWRAQMEAGDDFFARLLSCAFCLTYHVPYLIGLPLALGAVELPEPWCWFCRLPLWSLAATALAQLILGFSNTLTTYQEFTAEQAASMARRASSYEKRTTIAPSVQPAKHGAPHLFDPTPRDRESGGAD